MSDETKAGILTGCCVLAFMVGAFKGGNSGAVIVMLSTAVFVTIMYMDMLRERSRAARRSRRRSNAVARNFYKEMADVERGGEYDNR